jgi:hypothetical protein
MLRFIEYASKGIVSLPGTFPLHKKISSLRSEGGIGILYGYIFKKGLPVAIESEFLQSPRFNTEETFFGVVYTFI